MCGCSTPTRAAPMTRPRAASTRRPASASTARAPRHGFRAMRPAWCRRASKARALDSASFEADARTDASWTTLFSVDAGKGAEAPDGRREFVLMVEGVSGNDGNVFDVAVSRAEDGNQAPDGLKLYSFMPTFQVPRGNKLAELGFDVPADAKALSVENFDAAGGAITFAGRFRSASLSASGKSQWRRDEVVACRRRARPDRLADRRRGQRDPQRPDDLRRRARDGRRPGRQARRDQASGACLRAQPAASRSRLRSRRSPAG